MRLLRSTINVLVITIVALVYVHQQVELVKLSYAIEHKEKKLKDILDRRESLGYNINKLEAPSRLEKVLVARNINIAFPRKNHVVKVGSAASLREDARLRSASAIERKTNIFAIFDFFIPRAEAQAKER